MKVSEQLMAAAGPQWEAMLAHPFLQQMAEGTLPPGRFERWLRQDYLFVREEIGVIGAMLAAAPLAVRPMLSGFIPALEQELELFATMAQETGVDLQDVDAAPACHAYIMFLLATAHTRSFAESFTVLYGAEKAYSDSWRQVKNRQTPPSPYQRFIDHWGGEAFAAWIAQLEETLNRLTSSGNSEELKRMEDLFRLTARYEYLFWDMALTGDHWPV